MSAVPFAMFPHVLGWDDLPDLYWADLASLASDSFVFSRPLLQVQDLPNFVFVIVPTLYSCIFLALCCSATGAVHSKWRQQSTTKEKIFWLKLFFNLKCTKVISDYFIHSFVAVFIVADIFMCSIDAITSKTKVYIVFSSYSVVSLKWKKYCLFCRKLLYQAQTAPRKRLKFPFGMELRPISFWCLLGQGIFCGCICLLCIL